MNIKELKEKINDLPDDMLIADYYWNCYHDCPEIRSMRSDDVSVIKNVRHDIANGIRFAAYEDKDETHETIDILAIGGGYM